MSRASAVVTLLGVSRAVPNNGRHKGCQSSVFYVKHESLSSQVLSEWIEADTEESSFGNVKKNQVILSVIGL